MDLRSPAFADGEPIPPAHTCDGGDVSPPLEWTPPPAGARSLALTLEGVGSDRFPLTHWLGWSLPPAEGRLAEGARLPAEGRNDYGATGYRGPCPPPGEPHRYVFRLYALDAELRLEPGVDRRRSFDAAIEGHVLGIAELAVTHRR